MYEISQQKPCTTIVFLLQSVSEKNYTRVVRNMPLIILYYYCTKKFRVFPCGVLWAAILRIRKELYIVVIQHDWNRPVRRREYIFFGTDSYYLTTCGRRSIQTSTEAIFSQWAINGIRKKVQTIRKITFHNFFEKQCNLMRQKTLIFSL